MTSKIIDVQAHIAPERYLQFLSKRSNVPYVTKVKDGYEFKYGPDSSYFISKSSYDVDDKLAAMDRAGIQTQLLSIIIPGAEIVDGLASVELSKMINDELAEIIAKYPNRFIALATLPLQNIEASILEMERAITKLKFKGVMLFSNINGKSLSDKSNWPLFEAIQNYEIPLFMHPTRPVMVNEVKEYGLEAIVGYMFDTSLAAIKMVFCGLFDKFPNLKLVLPHAGGVLPYLFGRIDYQSSIIPDSRKDIEKIPSEYIKSFYTDCVCMSPETLKFVYNIYGPDRLLFASDFPYWEIEPTINLVQEMDIPDINKSEIFEKNARKLLNI